MFRVKSREGFISKWYTHHTNANIGGRLQDLLRFPPSLSTITQGQNKFTRVSLAPNNNAEVPRFIPSNYALLYAYSDMSSGTQPSVKLTVQTEDKHIENIL